jgi:hypothetical protein
MNSFTLDGWQYSQKYRQCGKSTCACFSNPDAEHGPYWYRTGEGGIRYVGKELPGAVIQALRIRERIDKDLRAELGHRLRHAAQLRDELEKAEHACRVFERAVMGAALSGDDRDLISGVGLDWWML